MNMMEYWNQASIFTGVNLTGPHRTSPHSIYRNVYILNMQR